MTKSWFDTARLGMFIHWGAPSVRGWELSWPMVSGAPFLPACQKVTLDAYDACIPEFRPTQFDARAWARAARRVGAQYAVLTTKHHDGFALFDTKLSTRSVMHNGFGRDVVREYVDAFRAEGIRIGLYFSLSDWSHPDYPAFTEAHKPYHFFRLPQPTAEQWEHYLPYLFGQIEELLTGYGTIDLIWFDGQWERMPPERWKAKELRAFIKQLQPDILINDRLPGQGDFDTPEQFIPAEKPARAWETCLTMNESWAYNPTDTHYKTAHELVSTLCEVASREGNLLLNVGPRADGTLPPEQLARIEQVGAWMERHGEAIIGTMSGLEPWQFYGPTTRRGDTVYLHLLSIPYETVRVRNVPIKRVKNVRLVGESTTLRHTTRTSIIDGMFNSDPLGELTIEVPRERIDALATVIAFEVTKR